LPGAAPGKEPPAKNNPAKESLPGAFCQTPGKVFAGSCAKLPAKKSDRHGEMLSTDSLPGAMSEAPGKEFRFFFLEFLCRRPAPDKGFSNFFKK
jgi:hypothetical protein